jgi:hypothetical protein
MIGHHVLGSLIDGLQAEWKVHGASGSVLRVAYSTMSATDADLSDRKLLPSIRRKMINILLLSDEELDLLTKEELIFRKDLVIARPV